MKKLTAGIFATLLAVVSVGAAHAEIASKGYVDQQVGTKADAATVSSLQGTVSEHATQIAGKADKATTLAGYGITDGATKTELTSGLAGKVDNEDIADMQVKTNLTTTLSGTSTDAQYPSAKAVWDTIQAETEGIASSSDLSALTTRVGTLETASATHATKTELTDGLAEKLDTATAATTYATKTELAGKQNTIAGAQLEALNSGITADKVEAYDGYAAQISGKLDTATADGKYAAKSTEGVASTASTNAQKALTNIGTLSELTTEAKGNTVAAINEVATEAAAAQTTANAALPKATYDDQVGTVSATNMGTTATTVVAAIKEVKTQADKGVSDAAAAKSAADAAKTAADSKLPTATYNSEVGTVSATNMGTTATTVVTAIKEVAGEASTAQSTATAAQKTANAAIPAPTAACADPDNKCVLVSAGAGNYSWEVIARGDAE